MEFVSTLSTAPDAPSAVNQISAALAGKPLDVAVVFASHHYGPDFTSFIEPLRERIAVRNLIGCTGAGIIGPNREIENGPAVSVWGARWPGVKALPFYVDQEDISRFEDENDWHDRVGMSPEDKPSFIILPEPYSIDIESCLYQMDDSFSGATIVGGLASGAREAGQNALFMNEQTLRKGMVGLALSGPVRITSVVSQGCRPVGKPFVVTKADQNVIAELGGRPALQVLQEVYHQADPADRSLIEKALHIGRVVDERLEKFRAGDFIIRNLMGVVKDQSIAVAAIIRPGQTIQFHVRDPKSAGAELQSLLSGKIAELGATPRGGLLFSCNGRGTHLFGKPNHDIGVVNEAASDCQVAGFFAAGEIGPVGRKTFVHGFTSSLVIFSEP